MKAEIVDDEYVGRGESSETPLVAAVGAGRALEREQLVGGHVEHFMGSKTGAMPEGLSDVGLADAALAAHRRPLEWSEQRARTGR